ncbi:MAG: diguanylate cyclase [Coriobacteriia bacterium]
MKFRHRILLYSIVTISLLAIGAGAIVTTIDSGARDLAASRHDESAVMGELVAHAYDAGRHAELYAATGDPAHFAEFTAAKIELDALFETLQSSEAYARHDDLVERTLLTHAVGSWEELKVAAAALGTTETQVTPYASRSLVRRIDALQADVALLAERQRILTNGAMDSMRSAVRQSLIVVVIVAFLGVVMIGVASRVATKSVADPILYLRDTALRIAQGDLEREVRHPGSDEIADLGRAFEAMRVNLRGALTSLKHEIEERTSTEEELAEANHELTLSVDRLVSTNDAIGLIAEMGQTLQSDLREDEAYNVMSLYGRRLFEGMRGGLYLYQSDGVVRRVMAWGEDSDMPDAFATRECWALRTGKPHKVRGHDEAIPRCEHSVDDGGCFECVPLNAHGEVLGTLVIEGCSPVKSQRAEVEDRMLMAYSEHVALALSNLRLREKLREQSLRDHLTGLYNRRIMQEALIREIARAKRTGTALVVAMIDVDHFKEYNDTYGHDAGDHVLVEMARYLSESTRAGDVACRYGGEEFVLIWSGMEIDHAFTRAEALRNGISELALVHGGRSLGKLTASIGLAVYPTHGLTGEALLAGADEALYEAKAEGRNRVVLANMVACAVERLMPEIR